MMKYMTRRLSDETREKISVAVRASMTPEVRAKIADRSRVAMTPERKAAMSAAAKARITPEYRERMRKISNERWASLVDAANKYHELTRAG